jgi:hypothetical protein
VKSINLSIDNKDSLLGKRKLSEIEPKQISSDEEEIVEKVVRCENIFEEKKEPVRLKDL